MRQYIRYIEITPRTTLFVLCKGGLTTRHCKCLFLSFTFLQLHTPFSGHWALVSDYTRARLIRSHWLVRFCCELSGNSIYNMKLLFYPLIFDEVVSRSERQLRINYKIWINNVRINSVRPVPTTSYRKECYIFLWIPWMAIFFVVTTPGLYVVVFNVNLICLLKKNCLNLASLSSMLINVKMVTSNWM